MHTEQLIRALAGQARPVTPMPQPWHRTVVWAGVTVVYLGVLIAIVSPRDDLAARMGDLRFMIEQGAALLTGLTAAIAAFALTIPGTRRTIVWLPVAAAALWLSAVTAGALRDLELAGPGGVAFQTNWGCVVTVLAGAAMPAVMMAMMLRRGVPLAPHLTMALGGLAAAALGNVGACVSHADSSNLVVLVWHWGTVFAVAALGALAGAHLLRWPHPREVHLHAE